MNRSKCKVCGKRKVVSKMKRWDLPNNIHSFYYTCRYSCTDKERTRLYGVLEAIKRAL